MTSFLCLKERRLLLADIKTKPKGTIKKIDKTLVGVEKIKTNLVTTKEKINEFTYNEDSNTPEDFASNKIQNDISYLSRKGIEKGGEITNKSIKETGQNFVIAKQKISTFKSKIKEKRANELKNAINNNKLIKGNGKRTIKKLKSNARFVGKGIKTPQMVAKNSQKVAKESIKTSQRIANSTKRVAKITANTSKKLAHATIRTVKTIIAGAKTLTTALIALSGIGVFIILIIVIIAGFVASIYNSEEDENYDISQISNSEIVLIAKAQIGNEGGDKFWKWYGFTEHVEWCACFVSWCANECGYIDREIIPKFSACVNGINWFKEKNQWQDRSESYYPISGDIIFFDWYDENGNQDGVSDHVGIVTRTDIENRTIYTIEGNTNNQCAERIYSLDDIQVMGYGTPKY